MVCALMKRSFSSIHRLLLQPSPLSLIGLCLTALSPLSFAACAGSTKAEAKATADTSHGVNFEAESENAWEMEDSEEEKLAQAMEEKQKEEQNNAEVSDASTALLGARHDVFLKSAQKPSCRCLSVALGQPNNPVFSWAAPAPHIDESSQQIIALGSEGVECDANIAPASYAGFEQKGESIIVYVEEAKDGQPITHGAIIPLLKKDAKVMIQPLSGTQLGQGLKGEESCTIN